MCFFVCEILQKIKWYLLKFQNLLWALQTSPNWKVNFKRSRNFFAGSIAWGQPWTRSQKSRVLKKLDEAINQSMFPAMEEPGLHREHPVSHDQRFCFFLAEVLLGGVSISVLIKAYPVLGVIARILNFSTQDITTKNLKEYQIWSLQVLGHQTVGKVRTR